MIIRIPGEVRNDSLSNHEPLTNTNISTSALEGGFSNGTIRFLKITKPSTVEFRHDEAEELNGRMHCNIISGEMAGDYCENAVIKPFGTTSGKIDHNNDHDVFCFIPTTTRNYALYTSNVSNQYADLNCKISFGIDPDWKSDVASGNINTTLRLVAGKKYYIDIWNADDSWKKITTYYFSIY